MASMDGTSYKTELTDEICNGHISLDDDQYGDSSKSIYLCLACLGVWPYAKHMLPNTPHRKVKLKAEYDVPKPSDK